MRGLTSQVILKKILQVRLSTSNAVLHKNKVPAVCCANGTCCNTALLSGPHKLMHMLIPFVPFELPSKTTDWLTSIAEVSIPLGCSATRTIYLYSAFTALHVDCLALVMALMPCVDSARMYVPTGCATHCRQTSGQKLPHIRAVWSGNSC